MESINFVNNLHKLTLFYVTAVDRTTVRQLDKLKASTESYTHTFIKEYAYSR